MKTHDFNLPTVSEREYPPHVRDPLAKSRRIIITRELKIWGR